MAERAVSWGYIDDFAAMEAEFPHLDSQLTEGVGDLKAIFESAGFIVHKTEEGKRITSLGFEIGTCTTSPRAPSTTQTSSLW